MSAESNVKRSISLKKAYKEGRKVAGEKLKKTYHDIVAPDGTVYDNVVGLAEFCRTHNIINSGRLSELCSEKVKNYKGWTYIPSVTNKENE